MSFEVDPDKEQDSKPEVEPTKNSDSSVKPGRKSFRVGASREDNGTTNETNPPPVKSVVTTKAVPEIMARNENLAEITSDAGARVTDSVTPKAPPMREKEPGGDGWQENRFKGRRPGDRYIRLSKASEVDIVNARFNQDRLTYKGGESSEPRTGFGRFWRQTKRVLIGTPLPSSEAIHQRLSKVQALAVLSSDALSSTAYATEQILLVLAATQGEHLGMVIPISLGIALLLILVSLSYRQTIHAYPNGGGSYIVAKDNIGVSAGLIAAAALMIDYILTVAVSITAGVSQIISAIPGLSDWTVELCLFFIAFIAIANLRGIRESGALFTAPTYIFIFSIVVMLIFGFLNWAGIVIFTPVIKPVELHHQAEVFSVFVLLRAFSSGCTALTGVEAISDGVPAFRKPESKNAAATLSWMAGILVVLFLGISVMANHYKIQPLEEGKPGYESVTSQIAHQSVGDSPLYFIIQAATAMILVLAANTAFSDFPRLTWFLARDKFLPHLFNHRGDRLAFSTGIIALAVLAAILVIIFRGNTALLIPLYAVGVFLSFTLSQAGMVLRWLRLRTPGWQRSLAFNAIGALLTFIVMVVIAATKFLTGAWIVILLIPIIYMMFQLIHRHYTKFQNQLNSGDTIDAPLNMLNHTVLVPVNDLNPVTRRTLTYARSLSENVTAIYVDDEPEKIAKLRERWDGADFDIPLVVIETPYRAIIGPLLTYIDEIHKREPDETVTVVIPEFITAKWWQQLLHNQTAFRLKAALLIRPGVVVTSVPYHLRQ